MQRRLQAAGTRCWRYSRLSLILTQARPSSQRCVETGRWGPLLADNALQTPEYQPLSLAQGPLSAAAQNLSQHLTTAFRSPSGRSYAAVCHRTGADCFEAQQPSSKSFVQTLAFKPGMRDEWVGAILHDEAPHAAHAYYYNHHHNTLSAQDKSPRTFVDENGVRFEVDLAKMGGDNVPLNQMRNGKWVAYAARALVIRFWDLAKKADSLDILLILAGYILMHTTFYLLLIRSRALGSSFWLPLAILSSAVLSFLIALPIAMAIKIPIDPVALTEALPFLVCTVGFDKPLRLARAVFLHPHLTVPPSLVPGDNASGYPTTGATATSPTELAPPTSATVGNNNTQMLKPAPKIITESLTLVYAPIIRDYLLEIAVLTFGAYSKVGGLKEVCALAALILSIDCLLMCTYLAAILGVMVEVS
jgi:hydroxymethylglutaryl-CoA reductase (NADPH)